MVDRKGYRWVQVLVPERPVDDGDPGIHPLMAAGAEGGGGVSGPGVDVSPVVVGMEGDGPEVGSEGAAGTPSPSRVAVSVLGSVEVVGWREEPQRRMVTELLCFLALHGGQQVPADELRAALWPGDLESGDGSAKSLRNTASLLRRCVGAEVFPEAGRNAGYRLGPGVRSDWEVFQDLVMRSEAAGPEEVSLLGEALRLVRGAPFDRVAPGSFGWAWSELYVSRMETAISAAAHRLATLSLSAADWATAEWAAVQGLTACPYDRLLWGDLLRVAQRGGRHRLERAWRDTQAVLGSDVEELRPLLTELWEAAGP